jgi:hypothetical protein
MPVPKTEIRHGIQYEWNEYSPDEMPLYWLKNDRYINDAKAMHGGCIVTECTEQQAKEIAAYFVNNLFAIATCTYYDGKRLSLCCDYAGSNTGKLVAKTKEYVTGYFNKQPYFDNNPIKQIT